MPIKRINEFPNGSDSLSNDDILLFMDNPSGNNSTTKQISINELANLITIENSGILSVVEDLSPQLGGNLDINNNNIVGSGNIAITGSISGIYGIYDNIQLNISADTSIEQGQIGWDSAEGTLDLGLEGDVKIHIGEHNYFRIRNETNNTLYAGQAVYASDVHNNILIEATPYIADGSIREIRFIGLVLSDIAKNQKGYAINFGHVENLDTRGNGAVNGAQNLYAADEPAWVEGDILYVHPTIPGKLTKVEPKHSISAAIILYVHQNNGRIFVRPTSYGHLDDNHDVDLTNVSDGDFLIYNNSLKLWKPLNISEIDFSAAPTGDPGIVGRIWVDTNNGNVLKISSG